MKIPDDLMAEIEADVERYRQIRIKAALRRLTEAAAKKAARHPAHEKRQQLKNDYALLSRLARRHLMGGTLRKISEEFGFKTDAIRGRLDAWATRSLNLYEMADDDFDRYQGMSFKEQLKLALEIGTIDNFKKKSA